ncbi:hypothetical protein ACFRFL_34645 [Streptomyces sp. NPDC056708]|uniref:hypothetical protein n=1 Tax=unclassified Streptomyces TaxID=2593676 RepID=UPI0036749DD6
MLVLVALGGLASPRLVDALAQTPGMPVSMSVLRPKSTISTKQPNDCWRQLLLASSSSVLRRMRLIAMSIACMSANRSFV